MCPLARKNDVYVEQLPNEVVIYDKISHQAHCLNRTVFTVWENADGTRTVDELSELLAGLLGAPLTRDATLVALEDLRNADLLQSPPKLDGVPMPSRRDLGRKFALAGVSASLLPFVASIAAPTPAMATSYTAATYKTELATATSEAKRDPDFYRNKGDSFTEYGEAVGDGTVGILESRLGKKSFAATEFQNAETEFNDMLKALGLPKV
ncbi:MAG: hypothetical protein M3Y24_13595 [Acidobacteriota bacterium]|nr:hypothetical protein [Acidobacteriota bacterium]